MSREFGPSPKEMEIGQDEQEKPKPIIPAEHFDRFVTRRIERDHVENPKIPNRLSEQEALVYQSYAAKKDGVAFSEQASDEAYEEAEKLIQEIRKILPEEQQSYFQSIDKKYFNAETSVGSRFLDAKNLAELLQFAFEQRGSLDGDDREALVQVGVNPETLMKECRYLKVDTKGEVGIVKVSDLSPDTKVKVIRTKPGTPCSLVAEQENLPRTDFGTVIIGLNEKTNEDDPEPSTKEMIWTAHPGAPIRPAYEDIWPEGSEITAQEVVNRLGNDVYLNVKREKKP